MTARPNEALADSTASVKSALVPSLDAVLPWVTRAVYVGASGALQVQFVGDADAASVTLVGLAAGVWHPMQIQKIISAGTTATSILIGR